jgi:hypothetical protein
MPQTPSPAPQRSSMASPLETPRMFDEVCAICLEEPTGEQAVEGQLFTSICCHKT